MLTAVIDKKPCRGRTLTYKWEKHPVVPKFLEKLVERDQRIADFTEKQENNKPADIAEVGE